MSHQPPGSGRYYLVRTLRRPLDHRRDRLRKTENQMKVRVDIVNAELLEYKWPKYLNILNTTNLTEKETLNRIIEI